MLTDLPVPTLDKRLELKQKPLKKIQLLVKRLPEPGLQLRYFETDLLADRCIANAHRTEREAYIDPRTLVDDPMMDQFLSSFACTMEWRASMGRG